MGAVGLSEDGKPCDETATWNFAEHGMDDGYVTTKRQAEDLVRAAAAEGLDAVIVNPTYMFGPYDRKPSSGKMIVEVAHGKIPGLTPGWNNFVDVRDAGALSQVVAGLAAPEPRVRFFAALAAGRIGAHETVEPLARLLRETGAEDRDLRHALVMGLLGAARASDLERLAGDESPHVRTGVLLVMRRMRDPAIEEHREAHRLAELPMKRLHGPRCGREQPLPLA